MWGALVVALAMASVVGVAHAERKRVVVLDFEGPRGERFHDDLVRLLKKTQTVVSTNQWNNTAEQLDAATMLDKDVRRVAKKLKVDAIIEGKIEKRREAFLIKLKLREGKTGEVVRAGIGTKSDGPRIDARAQRDIKDELIGAIDEVEPNHAGSADDDKRVARAEADGEDEDAAPAKRGKKADGRGTRAGNSAGRSGGKKVASRAADEGDGEADDEDDHRSARKHARDDEDAPAVKKGKKADDRGGKKLAKGGKGESDADDEDAPAAKKGKKVKVASSDADDEDQLPARARKDDARGKKAGAKAAGGGGDDEDKLPPRAARKDDDRGKKGAKVASSEGDDEDKLPAKKGGKDGRGFSQRPDEERGSDRVGAGKDDDERAALRPKTDDDAGSGDGDGEHRAAATRVASSDEDGTRVEAEIEPGGALQGGASRSPGQRAIELVAGASMTVRRMSFDVRPDLEQRPASYKGGRAPGAIVDATVYPLALGHRRSGILKDFGLTVMYDRVLKVSSHSQLTDMTYDTKETRLGAGLVFRHAFGSSPTAPVVLGSLMYSSQVFRIAANLDTPNVKYTMFEPGLGLRVPVTGNLIVGLDAKLMAITDTGQIQQPEQYGTARVLGLEGAVAVDYVFGGGLFARAAFRYETIGYTFKGNGLLSINRDRVGMTQDVNGARDTYFGGLATLGYLY